MATKYRIFRVVKEMTQDQVAKKTGLHQTRVSLIERGFPPTAEEEKKLREALGMPAKKAGR